MLKLLLLFCSVQLITCQLNQYEISPDVVDTVPSTILYVVYNINDKVLEGNKLTPTQVQNQPRVKWEAEKNDYYLLIMTDPDTSKNPPTRHRELIHWIVGNIPGNSILKGETLVEYIGAAPAEGSGFHRYIFLLYKQPKKINFSSFKKLSKYKTGRQRQHFSTREFIQRYNIDEILAANLFLAKWDPYVPILYEQLGFT